MKKILFILLLGLGCVGAWFYFYRTPVVVAFGDSLTYGVGSENGGFVTLLSEEFDLPIINLGVSGDTTRDALNRIDTVIENNPDVVIVLLGGNDFLQNVPADETFANLATIIDKLKLSGSKVVLLGLDSGTTGGKDSERFEALVREHSVVYVPNVLNGIWGNKAMLSKDNLHPNQEGYKLIAQRVAGALKQALGR